VFILLVKIVCIFCVACWFAMTPDGIETIIAIEKLRAIITINALIFLLEIFLTALVKAPKHSTFTNTPHMTRKKGDGKQSILASFYLEGD
jgi:hypothetical protein